MTTQAASMVIRGGHLLGLEETAGGGRTFRHVSPVTEEPLEPAFAQAGAAEVEHAAALAQLALDELSILSLQARADFLTAIAAEILALGDVLIECAERETGLPRARLEGERTRTMNQLALFAQFVRAGDWLDARIDAATPARKPAPGPDLRMAMRPVGPIAVFGASNFPFAFSVAGGDTAAAFAAGCPVIVKAHPRHPGVSYLTGKAIQNVVRRLRLPAGTFSLLQGEDPALSIALVSHPQIAGVAFTGSHSVGRRLFDAAAARPEPIPVFAEMASMNPLFLLPQLLERDTQRLAQDFIQSMTLGVGQFCTKPGLVFAVRGDALTRFIDATAAGVAAAPAGRMLHAGVKRSYDEGVRRLQNVAGVQQAAQAATADGCTGRPVVLVVDGDRFRQAPELAEEVFGPASLIVACANDAQMLDLARGLRGQLTAAIHGEAEELTRCMALVRVLERKAGRLIFNQFPTGVEVAHAMVHGGAYPSTTDSRYSSVGTLAIRRFLRPICYQNFPDAALPAALQDANPLQLRRLLDGGLPT